MTTAHEAGLEGDYLEFGVFRGYTLWYAQQVMNRLGNRSMRFFGFDSFEGFPEVKGIDDYKGDYARGQFTVGLGRVQEMLSAHGIDWQRTVLVPGFFDKTLTEETKRQHALRAAAVILFDCVLYESTRIAWPFVRGLLQDGSILVFDDWNAFDGRADRGERRAFGEFLEAHPEWRAESAFDYGAYGKAFTLRARGGAED